MDAGTRTRAAVGLSFREGSAAPAATGGPAPVGVMTGHFSVANVWTTIDSWEGKFMERFAPGAFLRTFAEDRAAMRVLFQHGRDPQLGDKILGPIQTLREDEIGAYFEVPLFDGVPALLLDGLRSGAYGASFRFRTIREDINQDPGVSELNPLGLPEHTVREAKVVEFGPVTFPAYPTASAGVA